MRRQLSGKPTELSVKPPPPEWSLLEIVNACLPRPWFLKLAPPDRGSEVRERREFETPEERAALNAFLASWRESMRTAGEGVRLALEAVNRARTPPEIETATRQLKTARRAVAELSQIKQDLLTVPTVVRLPDALPGLEICRRISRRKGGPQHQVVVTADGYVSLSGFIVAPNGTIQKLRPGTLNLTYDEDRPVGRPPKLTPAVRDKIGELRKARQSDRKIAKALKLDRRTVRKVSRP